MMLDRSRAEQVASAVQDEMKRFNEALKAREEPLIIDDTSLRSHGHTVLAMLDDWTLVTKSPEGKTRSWLYSNSWNWAKLLEDAGVKRHPLFA